MSFPSWVSACLKSNDLLFFNRLDAKHLDVSAKSNPLVSFCTKPGFYIHSVVCFRRQMKLFQRITSALHLSHVRLKQEQTDVGVPYALSISVMQWKDNSLSCDMECVFININFRNKLPILWLASMLLTHRFFTSDHCAITFCLIKSTNKEGQRIRKVI